MERKLTFDGEEPLPLRGEFCCLGYPYVVTWKSENAGEAALFFHPTRKWSSSLSRDTTERLMRNPTTAVRCSRCGQVHW